MTTLDDVNSAFWGKCVPVRTLVAAATAAYPNPIIWGTYGAACVVGNISRIGHYKYLESKDEKQTGSFGQDIWWNAGRYVHVLLMILLIILAIVKPGYMWVTQVADLIFGIVYRSTMRPDTL